MKGDVTVGSKWESRDRRDRGKIVEVTDVFDGRAIIKTISHPRSPKTGGVGWTRLINPSTLHERYRLVEVIVGDGAAPSDKTWATAPETATV